MSTTPAVRTDLRVLEARSLLLERAGVLLRRACRSLGTGLARSRKQAGRRMPAATGGLFASLISRVMIAKHAHSHSRMLAVEERLTLGPKQHMYLVRCGDQRLLVASAGEGALQWMAMPGALVADGSGVKAVAKRGRVPSKPGTKSAKSGASCASGSEVAR